VPTPIIAGAATSEGNDRTKRGVPLPVSLGTATSEGNDRTKRGVLPLEDQPAAGSVPDVTGAVSSLTGSKEPALPIPTDQ
jgi:hypothetical protein